MLHITATDLPRFLACNGSVQLEGFTSSIETDDTIRKEGDAAHWLIEQVHKHGQSLDGMLNQQAPNGVFITAEMIDHVTPYLNDIQGIGQVEFDTSFQDPEGLWSIGGRADHVHQAGGYLTIRDFKYGWRIVEPKMNFTLIWHVIGFLLRAKAMGITYPPTVLSMFEFIVYQPRPYHPQGQIRRWVIQRGYLQDIWDKAEAMLDKPSDQLNTGPHCYKCPAVTNCPVYRMAQMNALEATGTAFTDKIDNANLTVQLDIVARAIEILKQVNDAYEELALHRIKKGEVVPNFSVERALGNREWKDGTTPEFLQMMTGRDLTKKTMVSPTQAERLGVSKELVASFTTRHEKGIKLVRIDADAQANKLFNNQKGK